MSAAATPAAERPAPPSGRRALRFPLAAAMPPIQTLAALVFGLSLQLHPGLARWSTPTLLASLVLLGAPVAWRTIRGMLRGEFAADVVAMLAIVTAIVLREPIAGLVIVLMQTGGELLERYAEGRASDAVRELEAAAPRIAHRLMNGGGHGDAEAVEDVAAEQIQVGDRILVRPGEMVPCDAEVVAGSSALDTSRISG